VNRQLVQPDTVITANGIPAFVVREAAGDSRLRQPLGFVPASFSVIVKIMTLPPAVLVIRRV
jgi:hypothetical protein